MELGFRRDSLSDYFSFGSPVDRRQDVHLFHTILLLHHPLLKLRHYLQRPRHSHYIVKALRQLRIRKLTDHHLNFQVFDVVLLGNSAPLELIAGGESGAIVVGEVFV